MANSVITATMQLDRVGGLDTYLTRSPETSLFSYVYKQTTPFAKNTIMTPFAEKVDFGKTITTIIPFLGDALHSVTLYFKLPQLTPSNNSTFLGWTNTIAYAMISSVEIRIGETIIDSENGLFMEVMDYLTTPEGKRQARDKAVGRYDTINILPINALGTQEIYVPLQFWFTKKLSASLPLASLNGQNIRLVVKLRPFHEVITYDGIVTPDAYSILDSGVLLDYYILSENEKQALYKDVSDPPTYLFEQWQTVTYEINAGMTTSRFPIEFTRVVKELIIVLSEVESEDNNDYFNFGRRDATMLGGELVSKIGLAFDGKERFAKLPESYYRMITCARYHTFGGNRNIYCIPFAEHPESNQPTGTVNFTRYDNIELLLDFVDSVPQCRLHILGINYNRLIIQPSESVQIQYLT